MVNQNYNNLISQIYYKQKLLLELKLSKCKKANELNHKLKEKKLQNLRKIEDLQKKKLQNLRKIEDLQKNITLEFKNKTNQFFNVFKELKSENYEIKSKLIPDINPFIKTLNEMQIHNYNSLNYMKLNMDNLQKNKKLFELGIAAELKEIRGILHLNQRPGTIFSNSEEDVFIEDDKFLNK